MKSRYVCTWSANVGDIDRNKLRFGYSGMRFQIRVSIQGSGTRISGYPLRSLTFTNFYLKDLTWSDNNNNMYLGPVVAAQQVLDPSPETKYPGKEKEGGGGGGGGHIRYNQVFRSLIPGSRYRFTSLDVTGKVIFYC